ncbi:S1 RNA-binding domain-containing protein [candidate division WS5 bacterium]|uniref:S1 RNA-binding domain-containing protein n=1 Tax=candidate division WS5 bacterium TaxID=2093353 RepID=A0A419DCN1_9BACT|nr:MAG: S1 RNA-binding domain-containing protein [candidate division WS5 bacterium]
MAKAKEVTMEDLLAQEDVQVPKEGDTIEGKIINVTKNGVWLDLGAHGTGLVVGPEIIDIADDAKEGDTLSASVIYQETDEGYVLLSLRKATREKVWEKLTRLMNEGEVIKVKPFDANKGGLLIEYETVRGFLPVSQLSTEHYPRVSDKDEILLRLNELVGKALDTVVLDVDKGESKLIFSEKAAMKDKTEELLSKFSVGNKVKGKVTGVVDFGIFLNVQGVEGLVHISEISWDRVENPSDFVKVGDEIEVKIIGIEEEKISLSMKRLKDDPWLKKVQDIKVGDKIKGEVSRITPFGAFVKLPQGIEALVHISELSDKHIASPDEVVEEGKKYDFRVISMDIDNHKLALSLKESKPAEKAKSASEGKAEATKETKKEKSAPKAKKETASKDAKGKKAEK